MKKLALLLLLPCLFCFGSEGLPLYYYREPNLQNFGDYLSLKLVERIVKAPIRICNTRFKGKRLLAIGSIIWAANEGDIIWGSGVHPKHPLNDYRFKTLDIRAVRGPLTAQFLKEHFSIDCPKIYGDPGLLVPYFFPEFRRKENPKYEYLILPHYRESTLFPKELFPNVAYSTDPWDEIIQKIVDSKFVISSTLHGIVVAESFGIPTRMLRITEKEPLFKFQDYYLGTNRPDFRFATSIKEALELGGERPFQCDLKKLLDSFPYDIWTGDQVPPLPPALPPALDPTTDYLVDESSTHPAETDPLVDGVDPEQRLDEFVLETKKIEIPGHRMAFNPSIVRWNGSLLLSFRTYETKTNSTHLVGLVFLDENFDLASEPKFLQFAEDDPFCRMKRQDARLIVIGNKLFVFYNNVLNHLGNQEIRRMLAAEVHYDGQKFTAGKVEPFMNFEGRKDLRSAKNWPPFDYNGEALISFSIQPHRVMKPLWGKGECETLSTTTGGIQWDWGELWGGTPALLVDGEYLAFFHSWKKIADPRTKNGILRYYVMGAYTFSSSPPFQVTRVSKQPIVGKGFYHGAEYKTWMPLRVVFPGGFIHEGDRLWVAYGRQDHEVWIAKMDKKKLFDSLVAVTRVK